MIEQALPSCSLCIMLPMICEDKWKFHKQLPAVGVLAVLLGAGDPDPPPCGRVPALNCYKYPSPGSELQQRLIKFVVFIEINYSSEGFKFFEP